MHGLAGPIQQVRLVCVNRFVRKAEKCGLVVLPSAIFSASAKKHNFVANGAKWLLTECLNSCNNSAVFKLCGRRF